LEPSIFTQVFWLFVLALPIACIAWTVTHEEVFCELRDFCVARAKCGKTLLQRKFFYLFTCEYCFSHYVTIFILFLTRYKLYISDWRGYILAGFALVWIANFYMGLYALIKIDVKVERIKAIIAEDKRIQLEKEMEKEANEEVKNNGLQ
jgi:hypothetical protein